MSHRAFTLIELLVVISIIGLLSTVAIIALGSSQLNARNTRRKADAIQISKALELYYNDNGGYPNTSGATEGNCTGAGGYPDTDPGSWIPGLVSGGYMSRLPRDPNSGKGNPNSANAA
jgi:prepilin-type N-terminal cleavage/methylation domain-containing protein